MFLPGPGPLVHPDRAGIRGWRGRYDHDRSARRERCGLDGHAGAHGAHDRHVGHQCRAVGGNARPQRSDAGTARNCRSAVCRDVGPHGAGDRHPRGVSGCFHGDTDGHGRIPGHPAPACQRCLHWHPGAQRSDVHPAGEQARPRAPGRSLSARKRRSRSRQARHPRARPSRSPPRPRSLSAPQQRSRAPPSRSTPPQRSRWGPQRLFLRRRLP
jgi:hypothetical protein